MYDTDPEMAPMTLDCVCWTEGRPGASAARCARCVAACVVVDAALEEITGVTRGDVASAIDAVAADRLEGDPEAVLRALLEVAGAEADAPVHALLGRRGHYAAQMRRARSGLRPLPHDDAWTESDAVALLEGWAVRQGVA